MVTWSDRQPMSTNVNVGNEELGTRGVRASVGTDIGTSTPHQERSTYIDDNGQHTLGTNLEVGCLRYEKIVRV